MGYRGQILSIEPIRDVAEALAERATSDRNWRVIRCALGSSPGERELNIARNSRLSSFHIPRKSGARIIDQDNVVLRRELVPVRTLGDR